MHFFLTGEIQSGKSTVIKSTLKELNLRAGGFCTTFGDDRKNSARLLYMHRADLLPEFDEEHAVAVFSDDKRLANPERFDELGCRYLKEAEETAEIIVMDEIGFLENDAKEFQQAVLRILNGPIPVLGVLRSGYPNWTKYIANRGNVCVITVAKQNRDELPIELVEMIKLTMSLINCLG